MVLFSRVAKREPADFHIGAFFSGGEVLERCFVPSWQRPAGPSADCWVRR